MSTSPTTSRAQTHPSPRPVGPLVPRAPVATPAGQPAPILISDTDAPFPAHGTACSVCLTPVSGTGPRRHRPTAWPGCGHWLHFSCLARVRARAAPPRCPQCRAPWLTTLHDSLSQRCHQAALNPFQDSEHSEPEPPHPAPFSPIPTPTPPRTTPTATWQDRGPPAGPVTTDANSWLYVPLLHAGTGALTPAALRAWQQHCLCDDWWDRARIALHTAGPVPVPAILNALDLSPHHDAAIARAALAAAAAGLPPGAQVHLPWVLHRLMHPDGYFSAPAQEVCLQLYAGLSLAVSLDQASNTFRPRPPAYADPLPSPAPAPAPNTSSRAPARRGPRGGRVRSSSPRPPASLPNARPDSTPPPPPPPPMPPPAEPSGWTALDGIDLLPVLRQRAFLFQSVPRRLQPTFQQALRLALAGVTHPSSGAEQCRGWKLFLLAPRMLLHQGTPGATLPPEELDRRAAQFRAGDWVRLLHDAAPPSPANHRSPGDPGPAARAARAERLVHQGELSAARTALTAGPLAPPHPRNPGRVAQPCAPAPST